MAAVINLRVTPDQLQQKAKEVSQAISKMRGDFNKLNAAVNGTHSYWKGQAGDLHRKLYNDKAGEVNEILKMLGSYPEDLLEMAGIYKAGENANKAAASSLSSSVIQR